MHQTLGFKTMNMAILLSGGVGNRIHSDVPKQYISIGGRMLITYALATLTEASAIDKILIVAGYGWREFIMANAKKNRISTDKIMGFATPGFNRQASILSGMQEILRQIDSGMLGDCPNCDENRKGITSADTVLIHDAARPMLSPKQVQDCFAALAGHDGVMPVLPMKDTVYLSRDGKMVSNLLDRSQIFAGQAPELFRFKKYYQANMALMPGCLASVNGSTEPAVLAGMDIVMIPGDEKNFKITTLEDLERFRSLKSRNETDAKEP